MAPDNLEPVMPSAPVFFVFVFCFLFLAILFVPWANEDLLPSWAVGSWGVHADTGWDACPRQPCDMPTVFSALPVAHGADAGSFPERPQLHQLRDPDPAGAVRSHEHPTS